MKLTIIFLLIANLSFGGIFSSLKKKPPPPTALDEYVRTAESRSLDENAGKTAGSTWVNSTSMGDLARDVLASHVDDVVTIVVSEQASAVATGATKTSRVSSTKNSINALAGVTAATGPLANLANLSGDTELNGAGTTSRTTNLTTTLTTRVAQVLPNGYLVLEGTKNIQINSDWQTIRVRGVVRPADLAPNNTVSSSSVADLEVQLDGKGVVNDAIRRPMFLYRLLLGLLPF
jgi:flagellar L-ring protein precursor FlgH